MLITDRDGTVIGSGDRHRVGSFHEASVDVMRTLQPAAHNAVQARGVHRGVTLPIVLSGTALDTVGITGSPGHVRRLGLVVQRQTEILVQESLLLRSRLRRGRALEDLVRDVAYFNADIVEPNLVTYRAAELGYETHRATGRRGGRPDHTVRRRAGLRTRLALLQVLRATFGGSQDIVSTVSADRFVILHHVAPSHDGRRQTDGVPSLCLAAVDQIRRRYGHSAAAGIGDVATTVAGLHKSYEDASTALRLFAQTANVTGRADGKDFARPASRSGRSACAPLSTAGRPADDRPVSTTRSSARTPTQPTGCRSGP